MRPPNPLSLPVEGFSASHCPQAHKSMLEMTHTASFREQGPGLFPGCVLGHARYLDRHLFLLLPVSFLLPRPRGSTPVLTPLLHLRNGRKPPPPRPSQLREIAPKSSHGSPSHIHECYWMTQFLPAEGWLKSRAVVERMGCLGGQPGSTAWEDSLEAEPG